MFVHDFLENLLEGLIRRLGQSVGLGVVGCALLMNHDIVIHEVVYQVVEEVAPLVTYQFDRTPITAQMFSSMNLVVDATVLSLSALASTHLVQQSIATIM